MSDTRSYPRYVKTDSDKIEFRLMSRADEPTVLAFAQKLPTHDLLFLPRNISQPKVLSAWINEIERGAITSLLAVKDGAVVGCGALVRDPHSWSPHVGEIRMVVSLDVRGQGVGRALSQETFALALGAGLEKLSVQMTVDQQAAIALFESLGFKAEALLRDHVRDVDGKKHDIVVLGHNVAQVRAQMEAYGLPGVVQRYQDNKHADPEPTMSRIVYVLNGPNLNLLGKRQPHIYGHETLADVEADCREVAGEHGLDLRFHQSNREYEIIDWIHEAREVAYGIVINPAAVTHTSVAILDALNTFEGTVIEVHISNVHKREEFRHHSYVSLRADGVIAGLGTQGYPLALRRLAHLLDKPAAK